MAIRWRNYAWFVKSRCKKPTNAMVLIRAVWRLTISLDTPYSKRSLPQDKILLHFHSQISSRVPLEKGRGFLSPSLSLSIMRTQVNGNALKARDTVGNCQRPVFSLGVSKQMQTITNLYNFGFNWASKLRENTIKTPWSVHKMCVLSDAQ